MIQQQFLLLYCSLFLAYYVKCVPIQEEPSNPSYLSGGGSDYESPYKTICYFTNWGAHRVMADGKMYPEDIPADLCTHILYAFGVINGNSISHTIPNDIQDYQGQKPLYGRIMKLKEKNPKLKILMSCGGWGANGQFDGIVGSPEARTTFSKNVIEFCRKWGFDGIDLDWEFPGNNHKTNFGLLAETMYKEFDKESKKSGKPRLLTAIATAAGQYLLKQGYDIPMLCKWLDMINIMTYDLYGAWYNKIGHHSSLYHSPEETGQDRELNTNSSVYNWLDSGCTRDKISIGVPTYGRAFSGSGKDPLKIYGQSGGGGGGISSAYLGEGGLQTYYEICLRLKEGFKRYWDPVHYATIAYKETGTWIGYDDPDSMKEKCKYVKKEGLAGAMFWTLDMDDFSGKFCGNGTFPVVRAMKSCFDTPPPTTTTKPVPTKSRTRNDDDDDDTRTTIETFYIGIATSSTPPPPAFVFKLPILVFIAFVFY